MALSEEELSSLTARLHVTLWSVSQYADEDDMRILREMQEVLSGEVVSKEQLAEAETARWTDHTRAVKWMEQSNWHKALIEEMVKRYVESPGYATDTTLFQDIAGQVQQQRMKLRDELKNV